MVPFTHVLKLVAYVYMDSLSLFALDCISQNGRENHASDFLEILWNITVEHTATLSAMRQYIQYFATKLLRKITFITFATMYYLLRFF